MQSNSGISSWTGKRFYQGWNSILFKFFTRSRKDSFALSGSLLASGASLPTRPGLAHVDRFPPSRSLVWSFTLEQAFRKPMSAAFSWDWPVTNPLDKCAFSFFIDLSWGQVLLMFREISNVTGCCSMPPSFMCSVKHPQKAKVLSSSPTGEEARRDCFIIRKHLASQSYNQTVSVCWHHFVEEHWKRLCDRMKVHSNLSSKHIEPSSVDASNFLSNRCCWKKKPSTGSKLGATSIMDLHRVPAVVEGFSADAFLNLGFDQCRPGRTPQRWWKHLPTPQNRLICYWRTLPEDAELLLIPPAELSWGNQLGRSC